MIKFLKDRTKRSSFKIHGHYDPKYERVIQVLNKFNERGMDTHSQLCIYVQNEKVVDVYGKPENDRTFDGDTLQCVWSCGKVVSAILMAIMNDQGHLKYKEPVCKYWPEFAQNGKHFLTVADVMRHETGLVMLSKAIEMEWLKSENIKKNLVGQIIEEEKPVWLSEEARQDPEKHHNKDRYYHKLTTGWIQNEIFRRVEPQSRTMGEYLREEMSNQYDIHIGMRDPLTLERVQNQEIVSLKAHMLDLMSPYEQRLGGQNLLEVLMNVKEARRYQKLNDTYAPEIKKLHNFELVMKKGMTRMNLSHLQEIKESETPSAFTYATARGISKLANALAIKDPQLLSEAGWNDFHADRSLVLEPFFRTNLTQGGFNYYELPPNPNSNEYYLNINRPGFYGWMGLGGSTFHWHPELKIGMSYVPKNIYFLDFMNHKISRLQKELLEIVKNK